MLLSRHPITDCPAVASLEARAERAGSTLRLAYVLHGMLDDLRLPGSAESTRADELWRHTCFEAFVQGDGGYVEINLAPSTQWAAYAFDGYRQGMRPANISAPRIEVHRANGLLELTATIDLDGSGLDDLDWRVGLTAVVEDAAGRVSYWALQHPPGKPDFHNADCFALELPGSRDA